MIKRLIYSLLIILTVIFSSCKKENYHKVRFHIEFIDVTQGGYSNFIDVGCSPYYDDEEEPTLYLSLIEPGYEWDYEYWQLQDGEIVSFIIMPQQGYRFIMSIYIDDVMVSYKEIQSFYGGYYATTVLDEWGINNVSEDMAYIEFIYYE